MLNKPLPHYLNVLNSDDDALKKFLADPVGQSEAAGLSKAERAVLRRVVDAGSNGSKNGYSIVKPLKGYRQAVQLLQNVVHTNMGAALATGAGAQHTIMVYPQSKYAGGAIPVYPQGAYDWCQYFYGTGDTIGELMTNIHNAEPDKFAFTNDPNFSDPIISAITTYGTTFTAPPGDTAGVPFWFWSIDGKASPNVIHGNEGQSYFDYPLTGTQTVVWQIIAPTARGFPACDLSDGTHASGLA
ncbi:MAG: hypothetical protein AAGP08_07010 [Pseudomonadota bacterium]